MSFRPLETLGTELARLLRLEEFWELIGPTHCTQIRADADMVPLACWQVVGVKKLLEVIVVVINAGCARCLLEGESFIATCGRPSDVVEPHIDSDSRPKFAVLGLHDRIS